ncbi:HAAS signaling domain-containing protein [Paenibacillus sp. DMB20]|uniref:HAAS signaling domain-containing protein n=1 Tax=Paenibacillus sp. DMB20 TaxID=1642570 RepID=UPI0006281D0E|nr:hypothetical protein [Paenibacillus sp. DMB20]KKO52362.1 hypothetical protein XI25_19365 [Paenibacillus sp. DMB20]
MELVERYVYAVTHKLPRKQRADIEKELRGLIEDMLEERVQNASIQEADVEAVLMELGDPSTLAAKYRESGRYLISPEHFDSYLTVLKIVTASVAIAITVSYAIEIWFGSDTFIDSFVKYLASLASVNVQGFAWVTFIFAVLDYKHGQAGAKKDVKKSWKPADLPAVPNPKNQIKIVDPILGIVFSILFLVLFTFSLDFIGAYRYGEQGTWIIPVFNKEVFGSYLPFIWALAALGIFRDCLRIISGKWTANIVVCHLFFNVLSFILMVIMLSDPGIWNPGFMHELEQSGMISVGSEAYEVVSSIWNGSPKGLIGIIGLITVIDSVTVGLKLKNNR